MGKKIAHQLGVLAVLANETAGIGDVREWIGLLVCEGAGKGKLQVAPNAGPFLMSGQNSHGKSAEE